MSVGLAHRCCQQCCPSVLRARVLVFRRCEHSCPSVLRALAHRWWEHCCPLGAASTGPGPRCCEHWRIGAASTVDPSVLRALVLSIGAASTGASVLRALLAHRCCEHWSCPSVLRGLFVVHRCCEHSLGAASTGLVHRCCEHGRPSASSIYCTLPHHRLVVFRMLQCRTDYSSRRYYGDPNSPYAESLQVLCSPCTILCRLPILACVCLCSSSQLARASMPPRGTFPRPGASLTPAVMDAISQRRALGQGGSAEARASLQQASLFTGAQMASDSA